MRRLGSVRFGAVGALALVALGALGCEPEVASIEMQIRTTPPRSFTLNEQRVVIPVGLAVGFLALATDESGSPMPAETALHIVTSDAAVVGVDPSLEVDTFVLYGVALGTAELALSVNGDLYETIPVDVVDQDPTEAP